MVKVKMSKTEILATLIQQKYREMFGEEPDELKQLSTELAEKFSWNMPRAKANLEILTRNCWMRLRNK
jgi:diphthamide synthase subunit DPH2